MGRGNMQKVLGVKVESVKGTAETLISTDYDLKFKDVADIVISPNMNRLGEEASGTHTKGKYYKGIVTGNTSFMLPLQGGADSDTQGKMWKIFQAGGFVPYQDVTTENLKYEGLLNCAGITVNKINYDACGLTPAGTRTALRGAVINLSITGTVGQTVMVQATDVMGAWVDPADLVGAAPIAPNGFDTVQEVKLLGGSYLVNNVARNVNSFTLNMQATLEAWTDPTATNGVSYCYIATADPIIEITLDGTTLVTQDITGDMLNETVYSANGLVFTFGNGMILQVLDAQPYGVTPTAIENRWGETVTLTAPKIYIKQA